MVKKKVFVSFDHDNDRQYRNLLEEWNANSEFEFCFNNLSPNEIKKEDIPKVKDALTRKISQADYTFVIIGKEANKESKHHAEIGYKNWQNFEVAQSKAYKNKLVGVKLDKKFESPDELVGCGAKCAMSFTEDIILKALKET
ncbi:TIR domain-containing protein [uncultured Bacteroides sp.]|uniref:TIR domain-containing protein n=1 Tax=uncultured Bacteroides sp. TaxID=162156 RepID=UPI002AAB5E21|nr:TIR domain-containing protein [uncultured Bacteroides sp.]